MSRAGALVARADAHRLPLPDECVDLAIFSPPYYKQRRYDTDGIGNEDTPLAWLEALWAATAEVKRVLKPTGSIFVNLGDKYAERSGPERLGGQANDGYVQRPAYRPRRLGPRDVGVRAKSLLGLPYAYVLGCSGMLASLGADYLHRDLAADLGKALLRDVVMGALTLAEAEDTLEAALSTAAGLLGGPDPGLNLIWRRDQITEGAYVWHKLNGLPESVTDRARSSHEYVFHFTKQQRYYAALDTLRKPSETADRKGERRSYPGGSSSSMDGDKHHSMTGPFAGLPLHPLGKLPGSVWSIPNDPLRLPAYLVRDSNGSWMGDGAALWRHAARHGPGVIVEPFGHYAAFPWSLPATIIQGWSPPGVCVECGEGRWPVVDKSRLDESRPQARRARQLADEAGLTEAHLEALISQGTSDVGRAAATQTGTGRNGAEVQRLADEAKAVLGGYTREFLLARPSTILGWACACTPRTNHRGERGDWRQGRETNQATRAGESDTVGPLVARRPGGFGTKVPFSPGEWEYHLDGWTPPPTRPAVVLDCFGGVGTTALVARALDRIGLSFDLSHAYSRAARWRCFDSGEWQDIIAKTTGRKVKPLPRHDPAQERLL